ncbi:hypothetical protein [Psychroflexus sp. MES1-P1E]|uniref:hypothetical protein n=1 Tax=Psychroflexus sp. MES1-P1E TaxID=2058320 RepID=UPI000C7B260E|nr:hypothetical protein [Psychroflexus sp. MES1-P1E]PKG42574.1 hypothetical protein CXF67_09550 [Psychroflexus sp. MES1-P1E]
MKKSILNLRLDESTKEELDAKCLANGVSVSSTNITSLLLLSFKNSSRRFLSSSKSASLNIFPIWDISFPIKEPKIPYFATKSPIFSFLLFISRPKTSAIFFRKFLIRVSSSLYPRV